MNLPGHRTEVCFVKAALKTRALQTLRACRASPNLAKRLECVRFIGAFRPAGQCGHPMLTDLNAETQRSRRARQKLRTDLAWMP